MVNILQTQGKGGAGKRKPGNYTWVLVVFGMLVTIALPTMILMFFGLLPTLVAAIIDRTKGRSATFCVFGINFLGVFPYILDLWGGENTINQSLNLSMDVFALLVMYSAAAFGWLLFMAAPQVISSVVMVMQQRKIDYLRSQQKKLIEEWGPDVAALVEIEKGLEPGQPHSFGSGADDDEEEEEN